MKDKILKDTDHVCLFCGKYEIKHYDDCTPYYECNCPDAAFNRDIDKQIDRLYAIRKRPKFRVVEKYHLIKG